MPLLLLVPPTGTAPAGRCRDGDGDDDEPGSAVVLGEGDGVGRGDGDGRGEGAAEGGLPAAAPGGASPPFIRCWSMLRMSLTTAVACPAPCPSYSDRMVSQMSGYRVK